MLDPAFSISYSPSGTICSGFAASPWYVLLKSYFAVHLLLDVMVTLEAAEVGLGVACLPLALIHGADDNAVLDAADAGREGLVVGIDREALIANVKVFLNSFDIPAAHSSALPLRIK